MERAVAEVVARGEVRTYDLGGTASTMEMARSVAEAVKPAHAVR